MYIKILIALIILTVYTVWFISAFSIYSNSSYLALNTADLPFQWPVSLLFHALLAIMFFAYKILLVIPMIRTSIYATCALLILNIITVIISMFENQSFILCCIIHIVPLFIIKFIWCVIYTMYHQEIRLNERLRYDLDRYERLNRLESRRSTSSSNTRYVRFDRISLVNIYHETFNNVINHQIPYNKQFLLIFLNNI